MAYLAVLTVFCQLMLKLKNDSNSVVVIGSLKIHPPSNYQIFRNSLQKMRVLSIEEKHYEDIGLKYRSNSTMQFYNKIRFKVKKYVQIIEIGDTHMNIFVKLLNLASD